MSYDTFYPTPKPLIKKMLSKIVEKNCPRMILEPSAGNGDLIDGFKDHKWFRGSYNNFSYESFYAIEKDPTRSATLRGKGIKVIDSDFLAYSGPDKFDLIIGNPPFDNGDKHLLKAIDILYRGQIVFLLNAETLRNPHTQLRKVLARKLDELNAEVEFVQDAFLDAERTTKVEIAIISIVVNRKVEEDLFKDVKDATPPLEEDIGETFGVSNGKKVRELVAEYNEIIRLGTETIAGYYRNYKKIGKYIGLNREAEMHHVTHDLTAKMSNTLNYLLRDVRRDYWRRTFELPEVRKRMTSARHKEFEDALNRRSMMDFTEINIRQFVLNLIDGYEDSLSTAVLALFDKFSYEHAWHGKNPMEKNIHYFNGWKTNDAFKVGKKVIFPVNTNYTYGGPFTNDFTGEWELHYSVKDIVRDIDIVMNYFDGMSGEFKSIADAIHGAFQDEQRSSGIDSSYFKITVYKKGTMHLTFKSEDILRRFNVVACKKKGWLPQNYGHEPYGDMPMEERHVVDSFEGEKSYNKYLGKQLFAKKTLAIGM